MDIEIQYRPPKTLWDFHRSDAFVRVIVGPFGSGKSSGCVSEGLRRSSMQRPCKDGLIRSRGVVVRNTYRELNDTTRKTFEQWWPIPVGRWSEKDFTFHLKTPTMDCEVLFRALDTPADVKKLLSLELTWAYINELRELPKEVFDGLQGRVGRYPSQAQGGASWYGVWADSNPWHTGHWAHQLFKKDQPEDFELYEQPDGLGVDAENLENLTPGYYERLSAGKDLEWIDCYLRGKYPSSDKGSIYGALIADLEGRGGLDAFDDSDTSAVFTSWDLGHGDSTAIWFWSFDKDRNVDFVDHYESNAKPMSHYFDFVRELAKRRGYRYERHFLPHDARAKTLQTGLSIEDMCRKEWGGGNITVLPALSIRDGLAASRWLLEQSTRIHPRCSMRHDDLDQDGVRCLREYKRKWDENLKCFSEEPLHDWTSHTADSFRYAATVVLATELRTRPKTKEPDARVRTAHLGFSLDELHEWRAEGMR